MSDPQDPPQSLAATPDEALVGQPADNHAVDHLVLPTTDEAGQQISQLQASLQQAASTGDTQKRLAVVLQWADVLVQQAGDTAQAISLLQEEARAMPAEGALWHRLETLYLAESKLSDAAEAMQRQINLLDAGVERRQKQRDLATFALQKMGDVRLAHSSLQSVLTAQPNDLEALAQLRELLVQSSHTPLHAEISATLAGVLRAGQHYKELAELLAMQVDACSDATTQLSLWRELAHLHASQLQDAAGAFAYLQRAFLLAPSDTTLCQDLERLGAAAGMWEQLAETYSSALAKLTAGSPESLKIRRQLAEVLDTKLQRGNEALDYYLDKTPDSSDWTAVLPNDLHGLQALERLTRGMGRQLELSYVLSALWLHTPDADLERRKAILHELGTLYSGVLQDHAKALHAWRTLVELEPRNLVGLQQLFACYTQLAQPEAALGVVSRLVDLGPADPNLIDDLLRKGNLQLLLQHADEALKTFRTVLQKKREHPEALAGIEQLSELTPFRLEIAQVLEPIYLAQNNHAKLATILEKRLEVTSEVPARKALMRRIGDIYENRLNQKAQAFEMARRSLREDPADVGVRMWIEKIAAEADLLRELAQSYGLEAAQAVPALKLQFLRRAAALYHEKLQDLPEAVQQYRSIIELEPRDDKALAGLEAIFRQTNDAAQLCSVLQQRLQITAGLERKREMGFEIASLQVEALNDVDAALASLAQILTLAPDDQQAFARREALLLQQGQHEALLEFYARESKRLATRRSPEVLQRRLELLLKQAMLCEQALGDTSVASQHIQTIWQEDSAHAPTLAYLEQRAQAGAAFATDLLIEQAWRRQAWPQYVSQLQRKLEQTAETHLRRAIYIQLAQFYEGVASLVPAAGKPGGAANQIVLPPAKPSEAFALLARAYAEDRSAASLLVKLQELAEKFNLWHELSQTLAGDLAVVALADTAQRQQLLYLLSDIHAYHLHDVPAAIGFLRQALQYDPSDDKALGALDALFEKQAMWSDMAANLERRLELCSDPTQRIALLERLANLCSDKLQNASAALKYRQLILSLDAEHRSSLQALERLYDELQDWHSLIGNLQHQARLGVEDRAAQLRLYSRMGEIYATELSDNAAAIAAWQQVWTLQPGHVEAGQNLIVLLTSEEKWLELAQLYRSMLPHLSNVADKLDINRRLGVIFGDKLGQADAALKSWESVLEQDIKNSEALHALLQLYDERAMWPQYITAARRLIPLSEPAEAKDLRLQLAKVLGEQLNNAEEALRLAREVRSSEPHTVLQLRTLAALFVHLQAWEDAAVVYEKAAALAPEVPEKVALYQQASQLYQEKLQQAVAARPALEAILQLTPATAWAYLQLTQILRDSADHRRLVAIHEAFLEHAEAARAAEPALALPSRAAILTEIRDLLWHKLGDKQMAFIAACRLYKEQPDAMATANVAEEIAMAAACAEEWVAVLEDERPHLQQLDSQIDVARRLGKLYSQVLKDIPPAEAAYESLLVLDPQHLETFDALAQLAAQEERCDKQIAVLERKLAVVDTLPQKKQLLLQISHLFEHEIGDNDAAIATLQRLVQFVGNDAEVLQELLRLQQQQRNWPEVLNVLMRQMEISHGSAEQVSLRLRTASLCENELKDHEAAIQWCRSVLDYEPNNVAALSTLENLYTTLERYAELMQIFEIQLQLTGDAQEKIRSLSKMAVIHENEFGNLADAAACYERCLTLQPNDAASLKSLERLLRAMCVWPRLLEILEAHVDILASDKSSVDLLLEIAHIYYHQLARVDKAEKIYLRALKVDPQSLGALHALGQLYERSGNWFVALEMLQREVACISAQHAGASTDAQSAALPLIIRMGHIHGDILGDNQAAITTYQQALKIDPTYPAALESLKELARVAGNWEQYAEYLTTEAETTLDSEQQTEYFLEAARFFENVRNDDTNAIRFYRRVLSNDPEHPEGCRALAAIFFRHEAWEEAQTLSLLLIKKIDKTQDPKEFCQQYYRLGYISEKLQQRDAALHYYRQAFEADVMYLPALEALGQALLAEQQWDEAQRVFQAFLIHHRNALTEAEVVDVQWQLGNICLAQGQEDRAYQQFEKALEIDPDHPASLRAAAAFDIKNQQWELAYQRLSRLAEVVNSTERLQTLLQMSAMAQAHLQDASRRVESLERARRMREPPQQLFVQLAEAYLDSNQAAKAVEAWGQAALLTSDNHARGEIFFKIGEICATQLDNVPLAVQKYNEALEVNPKHMEAFANIERLLSSRGEWGLLEGNYRAMLLRVKDASPAVRAVLWKNLAELYHHVLRQYDNATLAYEVLERLVPEDLSYPAILAELYGERDDLRHKAISIQHHLLLGVDNPIPIISKLRQLYQRERNFDAVYVMCGALLALKKANEEETKLFDYLQRGIPQRASRGLSEDQWQLVSTAELYGPIAQLTAMLYRLAPDFVTVSARELGLKKSEQLDVRHSELYFANMVRYVAGMLSLPVVDVFRKSSALQALHLVNARPPALVAGETHEIFRDMPQRVVLYHIAHNMVATRAELFLPVVYNASDLRDILYGLMLLFNRTLPHRGEPRGVQRWSKALEKLPSEVLKRLQPLAQAAYPQLFMEQPLQAYLHAVEVCRLRVGLIAAGDLRAAIAGASGGDKDAPTHLSVREQLRELMLYATSLNYLNARKLTGANFSEV